MAIDPGLLKAAFEDARRVLRGGLWGKPGLVLGRLKEEAKAEKASTGTGGEGRKMRVRIEGTEEDVLFDGKVRHGEIMVPLVAVKPASLFDRAVPAGTLVLARGCSLYFDDARADWHPGWDSFLRRLREGESFRLGRDGRLVLEGGRKDEIADLRDLAEGEWGVALEGQRIVNAGDAVMRGSSKIMVAKNGWCRRLEDSEKMPVRRLRKGERVVFEAE